MATFILCYHSVDDSASLVSLRPTAFASQMAYLARVGYEVTGLDQALETPGPDHGTRVVITFDDGYGNMLTDVLPVLRRWGFPATIFLPTGYIGGTPDWIRRDLPGLFGDIEAAALAGTQTPAGARQPYQARFGEVRGETVETMRRIADLPLLSWDEARRLRDAGLNFGAHSMTHPFLTTLDDDRLTEELVRSREEIERELGQPVTTFSYPYGDFDDRVREGVRTAGYRWAVSTHPGVVRDAVADRLNLCRVSVQAGCTLAAFAARLTPAYGWYADWRWGKPRSREAP